uniref:Anti-CBASS protein Acb1-like N-terminal domain-containing protein n=1 Tax=viral metagenome TaxID=1070528 RepID=A0A6M3J7U8_9ZZZZ
MSRKQKRARRTSGVRRSVKQDATTRLDGWANMATGLGYSRDKRTWGQYLDVALLDDDQVENLYAGDDLAARIVDALPEHALRGGFDVVYAGDNDDVTDIRRQIEQELKRVDAMEKVASALCWGRLYGGGALLLGADDGSGDTDGPLDDLTVTRLRFLNDLERRDLRPYSWYDDPREQDYGHPEIYELTPIGYSRSGGVTITTIHESRLIATYGQRTPRRYRQRNSGWPLSVLQRVHEVLRDFEQVFGSVGNMLLDCSQGILSQKGLIRAIGAMGAAAIEARMASIDTYRASNRMLVLDADGETFSYIERGFAGVDALLGLFMLRMASAARMPVTVLFGRSPAGLNATGESDLETWYAEVMSYQEHVVMPMIERIVRIIAVSLGSPDPESWSVTFPSLWIEGPKATAERSKIVADRDVAYISAQVYEPEEVALARSSGLDAEIVIDEDSRRAQLDMDRSKAWEEEEPEPETEVEPETEPDEEEAEPDEEEIEPDEEDEDAS